MPSSQNFFAHWYFHVPNLAMAALIYMLIGRYLLELLLARKQDVIILKVVRSLTAPVVGTVRAITPAIAPDGLVIMFAIVWLIAARVLWFMACVALGMRGSLGG